MSEIIKVRWLVDQDQNKIAPKTLSSQVINEDGTLFKDTVNESLNNLKDTVATKEYVEALYTKLNSNTVLGFYCIEDVTITTNGISKVYPANSNVEVSFIEGDTFEIIPTSDRSILALTAFPGALGIYYPWLEGVRQFSNILFDMNNVDMYSKWSQGNQGMYQVQFAQYSNCIFWSDNPYIKDVNKRTNYTLYYTSQLPICYSTIPDNTFKAFFLALGVNSDPNWGNPLYRESFAKANWATQAFSYYGARTVGLPALDSSEFNIILPKDCRGLMFDSRYIENAGVFDAVNTTDFGAKSGSWRDAFGFCVSLKSLYIKNLKVNLNISWSPIDYNSIYYIISEAANTNKITISVSPYTYNLLSQADFDLAVSKNITIELLTTNYIEDKRLSDIANKADKDHVHDVYETKEDAQLKYDTITGAKADWNQNDENAIDYIKNRPFYEHTEIILDTLTVNNGDILNLDIYNDCGNQHDIVTVIWDGVSSEKMIGSYEYEYSNFGINYLTIGNQSYLNDSENTFEDTGEEYLIKNIEGASTSTIICDNEPHTLSIIKYSVKQIDEKFIPDTIVRQSYVDATFARKEDINNEPKTEIFLKDIENGFIYKLQIKGGTLVTSCETSSIIVSK